jgi:hypothetical protein
MRLMDYYLANKSEHEVIEKKVEPKRFFSRGLGIPNGLFKHIG